jgi:hypothetical protein
MNLQRGLLIFFLLGLAASSCGAEVSVSPTAFAGLPSMPTLMANVDHDVDLQGVVNVTTFDNFGDGPVPPSEYLLVDGKGNSVLLDISGLKNIPLGKWVSVHGRIRKSSNRNEVVLQVQNLQVIEPPSR